VRAYLPRGQELTVSGAGTRRRERHREKERAQVEIDTPSGALFQHFQGALETWQVGWSGRRPLAFFHVRSVH
jgi:hypothetical protein